MAKKHVNAWDKVTKGVRQARKGSIPKIEATLQLQNPYEFSFEAGSADSFFNLEGPLKQKVVEATSDIVRPLTEALDAAMAAPWGWSEGARDIIDTGELRNSLQITISSGRVVINYDTPYAGLVHYGGYITPYGNASIQKVYLPGRPWVKSTLEGGGPVPQFDFKGYYDIYL